MVGLNELSQRIQIPIYKESHETFPRETRDYDLDISPLQRCLIKHLIPFSNFRDPVVTYFQSVSASALSFLAYKEKHVV